MHSGELTSAVTKRNIQKFLPKRRIAESARPRHWLVGGRDRADFPVISEERQGRAPSWLAGTGAGGARSRSACPQFRRKSVLRDEALAAVRGLTDPQLVYEHGE